MAGPLRVTISDSGIPVRINDVPVLDISLVPSTEGRQSLGEPATTGIEPSIANAIFAATGARVTHIPITPHATLAAKAKAAMP